MPLNEDVPDYVKDVWQRQDTEYFDLWLQESLEWDRAGFYDRYAGLLNPRDGELIIDVGAGNGTLLSYLYERSDKAHYIAVERSRYAALFAFKMLEKFLPLTGYLSGRLQWTSQHRPRWVYEVPPRKQLQEIKKSLSDRILILTDDIRYPTVLPAVLGRERADALSLSMPGGPSVRALEWPFDCPEEQLEESEVERRVKHVSDDTRKATFHFAAKHLKDGGRLLIAERVATASDPSPENMLGSFGASIGPYRKYWSAQNLFFSGPVDVQSGLQWIPTKHEKKETEGSPGIPEKPVRRAAILTLIRNKRRFRESPLPRPS